MKRKVWDITVKDNPNRVIMGENDEFYTTDTEAYLVFNLDDENFSPPSAVLTLENRNDGSLKDEEVEVVDGVIEWEMPQRYIEHFGNWQGQLVYYDPKEDVPEDAPEEDKFETYTSGTFTFVVNAHIGDKKKPSLVEIENWEKFIREGTELIETWEDLEALREENERQRQENYQELLDTGVLQTNINTKLEQLEEEYAPKLTEVTAQLAQKAVKGDIGIIDLNKNKTQFDETWMTDEFKQQMAGNTPIHATPADKSITSDKIADKAINKWHLDFIETGVNLFDGDYIIAELQGGSTTGVTFVTERSQNLRSAIVEVEPNNLYTIYRSASDIIKVATNATYPQENEKMDVYVGGDVSNKDNHRLTFRTKEDQRYLVINVSWAANEPKLFIEKGKESSVTSKKIRFDKEVESDNIGLGKNLFNGEYQIGTLVGALGFRNGYLSTNDGRYGIAKVEPDTTYTFSKSASNRTKLGLSEVYPPGNTIHVFEEDTTGLKREVTFTTGEYDEYLVMYLSYEQEPPEFVQLEKGEVSSSWETYGYKFYPSVKPYFPSVNTGEYSTYDTSLTEFGAVGDGLHNDTLAIQTALNEAQGKKILIPPNKKFMIKGTIYVHSDTTLEGYGESSNIVLGNDFVLDSVLWRGSPGAFPIISTKPESKNIKLKNFRLTGNKEQFVNQRQYGIGLVDTRNVIVEDVVAEYINYFPEIRNAGGTVNALGYSLGLLRAEDIHILRGKYEYGGYENFGSEDVDNVTIEKVFFGDAWRTSFQLHRGSKNVKMTDVVIRQNHPDAHSAFTLHGSDDNPVDGVQILNLDLEATTVLSVDSRGGIQTVEGNEHNVSIVNSKVHSNNYALFVGGSDSGVASGNGWKITGNDIKGAVGIYARMNNSIIKNNTLETDGSAIFGKGNSYIVKDNILLDSKLVSLTGENFIERDNI